VVTGFIRHKVFRPYINKKNICKNTKEVSGYDYICRKIAKLTSWERHQILYRLPNEDTAYGIKSEKVRAYSSLHDVVPEASGFVVAPFQPSSHTPVFLFEDIETSRLVLPEAETKYCAAVCTSDREAYTAAFSHVSRTIGSGTVRKVVLARSETVSGADADMHQLFAKACRAYPGCYVALMKIPGHGAWLTATPELLYRSRNGVGQTTALAGTMAWDEAQGGSGWTDKNKEEQQMVADYIRSQLTLHGIDFSQSNPHTVKAGSLAHIQTDFTLQTDSHNDIDILRLLHPTPAVAGVPQREAVRTIQEAEGKDFRQYYAGFSGLLNCHGETACFVSLRLMCQEGDRLRLYAGGGILAQSSLQSEWNETAQKLNIMKRLLDLQECGDNNTYNNV
jgi:isochorismate synthase